jgi:transposase
LGPWWMAAQTFIRWSRLNVWERLLALVQEQGVQLEMTFPDWCSESGLDGTSIRAHQKAAGAAKKATLQRNGTIVKRLAGLVAAMAPPCGASISFADWSCVITDAIGRAVAFILAPGQAHELPHAIALLDQLPDVPGWVVADRGYSSHAFREHIWNLGARPAIPPRKTEAPVACPDWIYTNRNQVERLWARLKEWRAVATRYEKTASSFMGVLCMAAAIDWIKC